MHCFSPVTTAFLEFLDFRITTTFVRWHKVGWPYSRRLNSVLQFFWLNVWGRVSDIPPSPILNFNTILAICNHLILLDSRITATFDKNPFPMITLDRVMLNCPPASIMYPYPWWKMKLEIRLRLELGLVLAQFCMVQSTRSSIAPDCVVSYQGICLRLKTGVRLGEFGG